LKEFQFNSIQRGLFFAILPSAIFFSGLAFTIFPKWLDERVIILTGALLLTLAMLLDGPSLVFHFPNSALLMAIGQGFQGLGSGLLNIPGLPQMRIQANLAFPQREQEINDYCSGLFNSFYAVGQVIGPIFGSYFAFYHGYRYT